MTYVRLIISIIALFTLQACGGATPPVTVAPDIGFSDLDQSAKNLIRLYENTAFTAPNSLPTNDTAAYSGYLGATIYNNLGNKVTRVIGEADIEISFGGTIVSATGDITNFVDETQGAMQGALTLSNGTLDPDGDPQSNPTFVAQATGVLRWPNLLNRNIDVVLEGDLRGLSYNALAGEVLGQHSASGGNGQVVGSFILQR